jgi:ParB family chromosome partitioning protein
MERKQDTRLGKAKSNSNPTDDRGIHNPSQDIVVEIDPRRLRANPYQIRLASDLTGPDFDALVESIRKIGLIELPIIRESEKGKQIATGHRRVAACIRGGLKTIQCILRRLTEEQMAEVNLDENLKRKTVNPIEEARGYANFRNHFQRTEEYIAERFQVTRDIVAQRLRLLSFNESIQELVAKGQLTPSHAEAINTAPPNAQVGLAMWVIEKGLTVAKTTEEAKRLTETQTINQWVLANIGWTMVDVQRRLAEAESSLIWFEFFSRPWQSERCKHSINRFCQRISWNKRPHFSVQGVQVAKVKRLQDGNWHVEASRTVCAHCTLYEERQTVPNAQPPS